MNMKESEERYDSKKAYRDIKNSIDTAKRDGIAEGIELGKAEGAKRIAQNMQAEGMPVPMISKLTGLTEAEIENL